MNQLIIRTVPDGDGVWQIHIEMQNESFSGRGWCWGGSASLEDLASQLTEYPLSKNATLRLGYDAADGDDPMLLLNIHPIGSLGVLEVRAEIADADDPTCRLKAKFNTNYASIDRFVPQLRALASEARDKAVLLGD